MPIRISAANAGRFIVSFALIAGLQQRSADADPALSAVPAPAPLIAVPAIFQPTGEIDVQTLPAAAGIWLDGIYIGTSPLLLGAIPAGPHTITLTKSGWITTEFPVDLTAGAALIAVRRLREAPAGKNGRTGEVSIHRPGDTQNVRIDGALFNPRTASAGNGAALMALSVGSHVVTATVNGVSVRRNFHVIADTQTDLILDAVAPETGARLVAPADKALPPGSVVIEGRKIVIRHAGHIAVGHIDAPLMRVDGRDVMLDPPPVMLGTHVYLPVSLLDQLQH